MTNVGSRATVLNVYNDPSLPNVHALINIFFESGRHLKHTRSIKCLVLISKM